DRFALRRPDPAIALGIFVAAFVPMAAVFPALEPNHKGAAISVYNLSAGLSNFLAPAIAVVLLPYFSTIGVVIAYTALYILAFFPHGLLPALVLVQ
ncbi:hypothetical protein FK514_27555, partial [Klebsiella pneumoniae]|nr:hypothetical protein [Klebsiella pneumoniae]